MSPDQKIGVGVGILLLRDGMVLLGKRHENPAKASSKLDGAGTWTMPGGKVDYGETLETDETRYGEPEAKEPETITEWRWFKMGALPEPMYFPSVRLLENYRRQELADL